MLLLSHICYCAKWSKLAWGMQNTVSIPSLRILLPKLNGSLQCALEQPQRHDKVNAFLIVLNRSIRRQLSVIRSWVTHQFSLHLSSSCLTTPVIILLLRWPICMTDYIVIASIIMCNPLTFVGKFNRFMDAIHYTAIISSKLLVHRK